MTIESGIWGCVREIQAMDISNAKCIIRRLKRVFWQVADENMDACDKNKRRVDRSPKLFRQKHFTYREGYFFTASNIYFEMQWGTGTGKLSSIKRILSASLMPAKCDRFKR